MKIFGIWAPSGFQAKKQLPATMHDTCGNIVTNVDTDAARYHPRNCPGIGKMVQNFQYAKFTRFTKYLCNFPFVKCQMNSSENLIDFKVE